MKMHRSFIESQKTPRQRSLEKTVQALRQQYSAELKHGKDYPLHQASYPLINWSTPRGASL